MSKRRPRLSDLLDRSEGVVPLTPNYVRRLYADGGRLGLSKTAGGTFNARTQLWLSERWIASSVTAVNPHPIKGEGYSWLQGRVKMTLKDAIVAEPQRMVGPRICARHGAEFRVLTKILDGRDPIIYHVHAGDSHLKRYPRSFRGHRFGKSEAYYFLEVDKGADPMLHVGMYPGVTQKELVTAIAKGHDYVMELSPPFMQRFNEGFFIPAGMPHRPGTALTLEVQQPSDVYTLLESEFCGMRVGKKGHPGFPTLRSALKVVDFKLAQQRNLEQRYALQPRAVGTRNQRGGQEHWIFPPSVTEKFSGKRLRVSRRFLSRESSPYALLIWRGRGKINGKSVRAGDEFFVSFEAATQVHEFQATEEGLLEVFKIFPAAKP